MTILALILITVALFSQKSGESKTKTHSLAVKSEKHFSLVNTEKFQETSPDKEYLVFIARPLDRKLLNVSGIKIENKSGEIETIGNASGDFLQAKVNQNEPIVISENTTITISSGKSPVGVSFRENICSGFLNQYQTFTPPLPENCPSALSIMRNSGITLSSSCEEYLKTMPNCTITETFPESVSDDCRKLVKESINYNQCVLVTKNSTSFQLNSYRVYLNRESEFFQNTQDLIKMIDQSGKVVESKLLLKI